jgi:PTH1 family peptidyl-tRNA hydrolase
MSSQRVCIVGLGNPGSRYDGTRHNIGFAWIDSVVRDLFPGEKFKEKYQALYANGLATFGGVSVDLHFLKPQTFMNESGKSAAEWKQKNQGDSRWLVVYDDMDLALGKLRLRPSGSDGGHRGIRSIIERLGTQEIPRLRLGIGRPQSDQNRDDTVEYVLEKFAPAEKSIVMAMLSDASEQLKSYIALDFERAMNAINAKNFASGDLNGN